MRSIRLSLTLWVAVMVLLLACLQSEGATSYNFTKIADTNDGFSAFGGEPSINSAGTVAFHGEFDAGGEGIFRGSRGSITTIADTSSPLTDIEQVLREKNSFILC